MTAVSQIEMPCVSQRIWLFYVVLELPVPPGRPLLYGRLVDVGNQRQMIRANIRTNLGKFDAEPGADKNVIDSQSDWYAPMSRSLGPSITESRL